MSIKNEKSRIELRQKSCLTEEGYDCPFFQQGTFCFIFEHPLQSSLNRPEICCQEFPNNIIIINAE